MPGPVTGTDAPEAALPTDLTDPTELSASG